MESGRLATLLTDLDDDRRTGSDVGARLCDACVEIIDVSGAGIMLIADGDQRGSLGASNLAIGTVEELQFTTGEGPCVDACASREPVHEPNLADPDLDRWPAFAGPAVEAGVCAVFGFPLQSGSACLGALDLYLDQPGHLEPAQVSDAVIMAEVISYTVLGLQADAPPGLLAGQLETMLDHRAVVHQASGMLSAQLDIGVREALVRVRAHSYTESRLVNDVARDIVQRRLRLL